MRSAAESQASRGIAGIFPASVPRANPKTPYSHAVADLICARLAAGDTLTEICRTSPEVPRLPGTIYRWVEERPDFGARYWSARAQQALVWADYTIDLADSATAANWRTRQLQIDARKWFASKLNQRVLGDRLAHQQLGAAGQPIDPRDGDIATRAVQCLDIEELRTLQRLLRKCGFGGAEIEGRAGRAYLDQLEAPGEEARE